MKKKAVDDEREDRALAYGPNDEDHAVSLGADLLHEIARQLGHHAAKHGLGVNDIVIVTPDSPAPRNKSSYHITIGITKPMKRKA